jgi:stearoyl-CoA desaturase (Delta-9 desaturase)
MIFVIIFLVLHWYLSLFSQTFFLHRYAAHKMFIMNKFWERWFSILTYITQGSSYLSPRAYAILHRMHHAYSDTDKDPHSPHNSTNPFTMMWKTKDEYINYVRNLVMPEARFDMKPIWATLEWLGETYISRIAWGTGYTFVYIGLYMYGHINLWCFLLLPFHYFMSPIHGAIVNWSGHKYGYVNYDNNDKSRNSLFFDFLMMGELFQNNHHHLPNRINFAVRWYEIDPTYPVIKMLQWLRVIRVNPNPMQFSH